MSVDSDFKYLELKLKQLLQTLNKSYCPFDGCLGLMQSYLNNVEVNVLG